jgi:hypothetical protein
MAAAPFAKLTCSFHDLWIGVGSRDDLKELEITWRVEKVHAQERLNKTS